MFKTKVKWKGTTKIMGSLNKRYFSGQTQLNLPFQSNNGRIILETVTFWCLSSLSSHKMMIHLLFKINKLFIQFCKLMIGIIKIHSLCFISNAYKQRFLPLVEILRNLSNTTSVFINLKQHQENNKQPKTSNLCYQVKQHHCKIVSTH